MTQVQKQVLSAAHIGKTAPKKLRTLIRLTVQSLSRLHRLAE
jgi:hypothetical protein